MSRSVIEAETWLFDLFLKTANDGKIGFQKMVFPKINFAIICRFEKYVE